MAIESTVDTEVDSEEERERRPAGDRPQERPCLACGKLFVSSGWGNRLCNDCRRRDGPPGF